MNTIEHVRQYLDAVIHGTRRPFSLVDNKLAFECLQRYENLLMASASIFRIDYGDLKRRLTESPKDAANIDLYKKLKLVITPKFEDQQP